MRNREPNVLANYTTNKCLAEPRGARGRVHRGSKLWWRLDLRMRFFSSSLKPKTLVEGRAKFTVRHLCLPCSYRLT